MSFFQSFRLLGQGEVLLLVLCTQGLLSADELTCPDRIAGFLLWEEAHNGAELADLSLERMKIQNRLARNQYREVRKLQTVERDGEFVTEYEDTIRDLTTKEVIGKKIIREVNSSTPAQLELDVNFLGLELGGTETAEITTLNSKEGLSDGVFRVTFKDKTTAAVTRVKVIKIDRKATSEIRKMENLAQWLANSPPAEGAFKVAKFQDAKLPPYRVLHTEWGNPFIEATPRSGIDVENVTGRPLDHILEDPSVPKEVREKLVALYKVRMAHYEASIEKHGSKFISNGGYHNLIKPGDSVPENARISSLKVGERASIRSYFRPIDGYADLYTYFYPQPGPSSSLASDDAHFYSLKPDQVVVDLKTFAMTIIDPW